VQPSHFERLTTRRTTSPTLLSSVSQSSDGSQESRTKWPPRTGRLVPCCWILLTSYRYEGAAHNGFGNVLVLLSISLAVLDSLGLIKRAIAFYRRRSDRSWLSFTREVLRSSSENKWLSTSSRYEMVGFLKHDVQGEAVVAVGDDEDEEQDPPFLTLSSTPDRPGVLTRQRTPPSRNSTSSDGTLHDSPTSSGSHGFEHKPRSQAGAYDVHHESVAIPEKKITSRRMIEILLTWVRRTQVIIAYVVVLTGITIYTVSLYDLLTKVF